MVQKVGWPSLVRRFVSLSASGPAVLSLKEEITISQYSRNSSCCGRGYWWYVDFKVSFDGCETLLVEYFD